MNINRNEILKQAIAIYGGDAQTDVCIEECGELIKALLKYRRYERFGQTCDEQALANIREEIADVQIMIDQMRLIYGDTVQEEIYKLERLVKRIEEIRRRLPWMNPCTAKFTPQNVANTDTTT